TGPSRDRRRSLVEDRDDDRRRGAREGRLGHVRLDVRQLEEAVRHDRLYLALEALHDVVDPVPWAGGLAAVLAHDVVRLAVALDVRRVRRDVDPGAVRGLLLVGERV